MNTSIILQNLKTIGIVLAVLAAVWFYKDYEFQKIENKRQSENVSELRKSDSLRFTSQILTKDEIKEYLEFQNSDLNKKLKAEGIKVNKIESIVSQTLKFRDTTKRETDVSGLVGAIKNSIPKEQTWLDTAKCMTVSGTVSFDGEKLKVVVNDREFKNKSDAVAYWERRKWSFLGIKTRLFGKKVFTAKTFDECGETRIMKIERKK
ncbi:hypothetical protein [Flavobacterium johnsoniae]|uniref:Uncharacterized protein n=1 Tax=Flavobacterium johnsoniae TaxID=986 RepID=A0A1M5IG67_FLAJO|nr:hypothetical protein [Flavobacterium johnsoniae]SHG27292.1 hypothetical protein SAMN05444388_10287 [Flavobacterium johnsoniae]